MSIATSLDKVRLLVGDTDSTDPLFYDDEINWFLEDAGNVIKKAAALACDAAAAKYSRTATFQTDDQKFELLARAAEFREMADRFRAQAGGATGVVPTKQDGYSQDIPADQLTAGGGTRGRQNHYTFNDRVF